MKAMKTIKTADLAGNALDWAVAQCAGVPVHILSSRLLKAVYHNEYGAGRFQPSKKWEQAGPIIEREGPWVRESAAASPAIAHLVTPDKKWFAYAKSSHDGTAAHCYYGETFLIAAMRCYVASKMGDEVQVPENLA